MKRMMFGKNSPNFHAFIKGSQMAFELEEYWPNKSCSQSQNQQIFINYNVLLNCH